MTEKSIETMQTQSHHSRKIDANPYQMDKKTTENSVWMIFENEWMTLDVIFVVVAVSFY